MPAAFSILVALVLLTPVTLLLGSAAWQAAMAFAVALGLGLVAVSIQAAEANHFNRLTRFLLPLAALPAVWMIIQVLPLRALANPVWDSAAGALGRPMSGAISVDIGVSLEALTRYCLAVGTCLLATAVAIDRRRAEWLLFALTVATTLFQIAAWIWAHNNAFAAYGTAVDVAGLGAVLALGCGELTYERRETRRRILTWARLAPLVILALVALCVCVFTIVRTGETARIFATGCGIATFLMIVLIRRLGLGGWSAGSLGAVALVLAIGLALSGTQTPKEGPSDPPTAADALMHQVLADPPPLGTGAGTFATLVPLYKSLDVEAVAEPTDTEKLSLELGRTALWIAIGVTILSAGALIGAALLRGRDSAYATAGAGALVTCGLMSFLGPGLFTLPGAVLIGTVLGLSLAQSRGRSLT